VYDLLQIRFSLTGISVVLQETTSRLDDSWKLVLNPAAPGFQYETLGQITRSNVVRGSASSIGRGVTHTDFDETVFQRRKEHMEPAIGQHHKQRDHLSWFLYIC